MTMPSPQRTARTETGDPLLVARELLGDRWHALSESEQSLVDDVLRRMASHQAVTRDANREFRAASTFGERMSDAIAAFGGSWTFILLFIAFLAGWAVLNTEILGPRRHAFDPYPYIFLNLLLSMIAALQAPLIMMSQNRAAARDRIEAQNDYAVNLKSEVEIRALHAKLDVLREQQWADLVALQHEQIRLLTVSLETSTRSAPPPAS